MTTLVEQYQTDTDALAAKTAAGALAVYAAWQAGDVSLPEAAALIATAVVTANAAAGALADAYVAAHIERATGVPTPTVGLPPRDDTERLTKAVRTILDGTDETVNVKVSSEPADEPPDTAAMQIERLAHSEPLRAAQRATLAVMDAQPTVTGWRRQMDADPCELCTFWWAGGRIYRTTTVFHSHPGCNCQPEPVFNREDKNKEIA